MPYCNFAKYEYGRNHCYKIDKDVDDDWYEKYCKKKYDYDECPIFKGDMKDYESNRKSGCFITTACVCALNKDDNCYELTLLRSFRDTYMQEDEARRNDIQQYYIRAPKIVDYINKEPCPYNLYIWIYETFIKKCISFIENNKFDDAYILYRNMVNELIKKLQVKFL
jgi:hypothetical protein